MTEQPQSNVLKVPLAKEQTFLSKMIQKYEKNVIEMQTTKKGRKSQSMSSMKKIENRPPLNFLGVKNGLVSQNRGML